VRTKLSNMCLSYTDALFSPHARQNLFDVIKSRLLEKGGLLISGTDKGKTQASGTKAEGKVKEVLDELNLEYDVAPSQQHRDFRNIGNIGLDIEVKKSDKGIIKCNDTRPPEDVFYIVFLYQSSTKKSKNKPCIWFGTGDEICCGKMDRDIHEEQLEFDLNETWKAHLAAVKRYNSGTKTNVSTNPRRNWSVNCTRLSGKIELDLEQ
jgi:hypothetical protein